MDEHAPSFSRPRVFWEKGCLAHSVLFLAQKLCYPETREREREREGGEREEKGERRERRARAPG